MPSAPAEYSHKNNMTGAKHAPGRPGPGEKKRSSPSPACHELILASASPRRLQLLAQIGIAPSRVVPPEIDEAPLRRELPRVYAERIARNKALAVAGASPGSFVLAADTVVALGRRILPKAEDRKEARRCLELLSGRSHQVHGAITLVTPDGVLRHRLVTTRVTFARLSSAQIEDYLASGEWEGKAGGYAIQGKAAVFIPKISGSYPNVVGLALAEVANLLQGCGWRPDDNATQG